MSPLISVIRTSSKLIALAALTSFIYTPPASAVTTGIQDSKWEKRALTSQDVRTESFHQASGLTQVDEIRPRRAPVRKLYSNDGNTGLRLPNAQVIDKTSGMQERMEYLLDRNRPKFQASKADIKRLARRALNSHAQLRFLANPNGATRLSKEPKIYELGDATRACFTQEVRVPVVSNSQTLYVNHPQIVSVEYIPVADSSICFSFHLGNLVQVGLNEVYTPETFSGLTASPSDLEGIRQFASGIEVDSSLGELVDTTQLQSMYDAGLLGSNAPLVSSIPTTFRVDRNRPVDEVVHKAEQLVFVPEIGLPEVGYRTVVTAEADISAANMMYAMRNRAGEIVATRNIDVIHKALTIDMDATGNPISIQEKAAHQKDTNPPPNDPNSGIIDWASINHMAASASMGGGDAYRKTPSPQTVSMPLTGGGYYTEDANLEIFYPDQITTDTGGLFGNGVFRFPLYLVDNRENPMRLWDLNTKTVGSLDGVFGPTVPTSGTNNFFHQTEATGIDNLRTAEAMASFFHQRQVHYWNIMLTSIGGSPIPDSLHVNALDLGDPNSYFSPNGPETGGPEIHLSGVANPHGMDASIIRHEMCHAYLFFIGGNVLYTPGTEYAALVEGIADACASTEDHYIQGAFGLSTFSRSAEDFLTYSNYGFHSDHTHGQILSIAIRNMARILGDFAPMLTLMQAHVYIQNGDTFVDFRNAMTTANNVLWGGLAPQIQMVIDKVFALQEIGPAYTGWDCDVVAAGQSLPMPDGAQEVIEFTPPQSGNHIMFFSPYSSMHKDDLMFFDHDLPNLSQGNAGDNPVNGVYWDEVTNAVVAGDPSPFAGRVPQIGLFRFDNNLRVECISQPGDLKISAGLCGKSYKVQGTGGSYLPPVADLQINVTDGIVPMAVLFDTSGTYDPDGGEIAAKYIFFDNNPNPVALDLQAGQELVAQTFSVKDLVGLNDTTTGGTGSIQIRASLIVFDDEGQLNRTSKIFTLNQL